MAAGEPATSFRFGGLRAAAHWHVSGRQEPARSPTLLKQDGGVVIVSKWPIELQRQRLFDDVCKPTPPCGASTATRSGVATARGPVPAQRLMKPTARRAYRIRRP